MDKVLKSFEVNDTLCPDIWVNSDSDDYSTISLYPEIRQRLLFAANAFIDYLNIEIFEVIDITLTGSISNFNWSAYSDIDLHIITDQKQITCNDDLLTGFFNSKKNLFNTKIEDASIKGHDIELYIQDIDQPHHSSGVYSVLKNTWIITPEKENFDIDINSVDKKKNQFVNQIDKLEVESNKEGIDINTLSDKINHLREKIRKYRQSGLAKSGESSDENIVFKYLRRSGYLQKLIDIRNRLFNDFLTIEAENH